MQSTCIIWGTGSANDFVQIMGVNCLNIPNYASTSQRDGVLFEKCRFMLELKNNSTADYQIDEYWLRNRWDTNSSVGLNIDLGLQYLGTQNQGSAASSTNYPFGMSIFEIPNMTSHYNIVKRKKWKFKTGQVVKRRILPIGVEGLVHNPAVLNGNGLQYKAKYTLSLLWIVSGCLGHEAAEISKVVRSEIVGIDWEGYNLYQARMIKQDYSNGTTYGNPTVVPAGATLVGVKTGESVTAVRDVV